jgi:hypothetical protein
MADQKEPCFSERERERERESRIELRMGKSIKIID